MLKVNNTKRLDTNNQKFLSIIIPNFNESVNIINLINNTQTHIPISVSFEIIVVDYNPHDTTGLSVGQPMHKKEKSTNTKLNNYSSVLGQTLSSLPIKIK